MVPIIASRLLARSKPALAHGTNSFVGRIGRILVFCIAFIDID